MKTGEGKTLTSVLPAYLNALSGDGVHLVTTNDYLAKRDAENMGRIHRFLGLSVGVILSEMTPLIRRGQYLADITYGTNNEFGFDYLRDNMAWNSADMVQRGHNFAVVDEADSILIDEARTPLIISGPAEQSARWYQEFARMAPMLKKDIHYEVDERKRTVGVTEDGVTLVEDQLGIDNLYEAANTPLVGYLKQRPEGQGAVQEGQGLHRPRRAGLHRRRVHRPRARRPSLQRGHAPGHRGQGRGGGPGGEPDAGHHHPAELLPALHEALRHDGHRADRGGGAAPDLQARRRSDPDEQADDPCRPAGPDLQDRGGEVRGRRRRHRREAREGPAGAGRHHQRREVGVPGQAARAAPDPARGAQRQAPRARGRDRRAGRALRCRHRRHEHGGPRHGHRARWQPRVPRRPGAAPPRTGPRGDARGVRGPRGTRPSPG